MTLEDLGNIGEFVAAVAVVISLVYLAVQIRQNTTSVRLSNYLASETLSSESARPIVEDPDLARLWRIGLADFRSLDDDEKIRFTTLFLLQFRAYEQMFLQHQSGLIDLEVWEARRDAMLQWISVPGVQTMWKLRRHSFTKSFREYVEQAGPSADEQVTSDEAGA